MPIKGPAQLADGYDLVVAGSGFGSLFFLHKFLRSRPHARVLVLEWGQFRSHSWQIENQKNGDVKDSDTFVAVPGEKPWSFTVGFGGGTNCWWAQTPRWMPNDFRLRSLYGVGRDWPFGYDELEPFYLEAERIMMIAGPNDLSRVYPRSGPYPQPPHAMSDVDRKMKQAMPDRHFSVPCARLRIPVGARGACCMSNQCDFCPTEAKFTALNGMTELIENPRLDLCVGSRVLAVETAGGKATGLRFTEGGREHVARGDLVVLAANAIHTPFILQSSGIHHPALGKYLHEKSIAQVEVMLGGVDNFGGGIPTSGYNISLIDGPHRREAGAALVFFENFWKFNLRSEYGRWRQTLPLTIFVEEMPEETSTVTAEGGPFPHVRHPRRSPYAEKGIERAITMLPDLLAALPVESITRQEDLPTGSHVQGTVRMGDDPVDSVVDAELIHHQVRNLLVLGTAVFPSCGTANPSLTAAALSLRAAARLASSS